MEPLHTQTEQKVNYESPLLAGLQRGEEEVQPVEALAYDRLLKVTDYLDAEEVGPIGIEGFTATHAADPTEERRAQAAVRAVENARLAGLSDEEIAETSAQMLAQLRKQSYAEELGSKAVQS